MKHIYFILISCLISISSYAQQENIEMTHYLFPEFTQGVILMKSGIRNGAFLNYDSLTEEMIFDKAGKKLAIAPNELKLVDTVFIKDRKFIPIKTKNANITNTSNFLPLIFCPMSFSCILNHS